MRSLILASVMLLTTAGAAPLSAQRITTPPVVAPPPAGVPPVIATPAAPAPPPPPLVQAPPPPPPLVQASPPPPPPVGDRGQHWGHLAGGQWEAASRAPGGLGAYHRPYRGFRLPRYWVNRQFLIEDFGYYGLPAPPFGYSWSRYYDDAVLIDTHGRVADAALGLEWLRPYGGHAPHSAGHGYATQGYHHGFQDGPGAGYGPPPPIVQPLPGGGYSTTYTTGGYSTGPVTYSYSGPTTTTITIQSAPAVTTTTTEYITEYRTEVVRKAWRKPVVRKKTARKWKPKPVQRACTCTCGCRQSGRSD